MVTIRMTLTQHRLVRDGNWPNDCPRGWGAIETAPRVGKTQIEVTLCENDLTSLTDYVRSVVEVEQCMSYEERGSNATLQCARRFLARLKEVS